MTRKMGLLIVSAILILGLGVGPAFADHPGRTYDPTKQNQCISCLFECGDQCGPKSCPCDAEKAESHEAAEACICISDQEKSDAGFVPVSLQSGDGDTAGDPEPTVNDGAGDSAGSAEGGRGDDAREGDALEEESDSSSGLPVGGIVVVAGLLGGGIVVYFLRRS